MEKNFFMDDNIIQAALEDESTKNFLALFGLDDENFNQLAPILMLQFEKEFNNPTTRLNIVKEFENQNMDLEEIENAFIGICSELEKEEFMSQTKLDFIKMFFGMLLNVIEEETGKTKEIVNIPIEFCAADAKMPTYANIGDAGLDIYALEDYTVLPGQTVLIRTGIKVAIPLGYELQVRPKSGISLKSKLRVANTPGTVDSGYRDEVCVIVENIEHPIQDITYHFDETNFPPTIIIDSILHGKPYNIEKGQKIAQLVLNKISTVNWVPVDSILEVEGNRGGGFGSTGLK